MTAAVDVYALGAVLHTLLAGRPPFDGASVYEVLLKVSRDPPPPLRSLDPGLPAGLEAACLRCLAKTPGERYGSAAELAAALRGWLAQGDPPPRPATWRGWLQRLLGS